MTTTQIAPQHQDLLDINDVPPFRPEQDQPIFDEIKAVLTKHNALSRFGVCLLHRHFDVNEGEMLLEECDSITRTLTIKPVVLSQKPDLNFMETNWRFDVEGASQACTLICVGSGGRHNDTSHISN